MTSAEFLYAPKSKKLTETNSPDFVVVDDDL